MKCPYCGFGQDRVVDSRESKEADAIRRRRECERCNRRFTTYERIDEIPYMVVKKDGRRERFDRQKVLSGLLRACEKRPVPSKKLEAIVDATETFLMDAPERGAHNARDRRADHGTTSRASIQLPISASLRSIATSRMCANSRKNWKSCSRDIRSRDQGPGIRDQRRPNESQQKLRTRGWKLIDMTETKTHRVTLIPGDGIGPEVTQAVVRILEATGVKWEWERYSAGAEAFRDLWRIHPHGAL